VNDPVRILVGDVLDGLRSLPDGSVQCCVTSPPYWGLRDYGVEGQIGLEPTPEAFVAKMVEVFREVRRVLREDGVCFLNIGDSYNGSTSSIGKIPPSDLRESTRSAALSGGKIPPQGSAPRVASLKPKDLCMIPWRVALALQADGWYLRSVIVWAKKSPMPESVTDRPTSSWEPIFLLAKGERYFYDAIAVKEAMSVAPHAPGNAKLDASRNDHESMAKVWGADGTRNQRNVWHLGPEPYSEAHFATFPTEIPRRAIKAGTSEKGACPDCGAPWARVVELVGGRTTGRTKERQAVADSIGKPGGANYGGGLSMKDIASSRTTGWQPTCRCGNPNTVPCVVLDPFLGSGTTIAVARTLGRHGVGCELNPAYAALARDRIGRAEKPSTYVAEKADDSPLFAGDPK
jgi:DNA modification methylase